MAKVTEKSTKKVIYDAYMKEKQKNAKPLNERTTIERKRSVENVNQMSKVSTDDIVNNLAAVRLSTNSVISEIEETILSKKQDLENLNNAISFQKKELETIHGITAEADSLQAIISAKETTQVEIEELKLQSQNDLHLRDEESLRVIKEREESAKKAHQRRLEENKYEFEQTVKKQKQQIEDAQYDATRYVTLKQQEADDLFSQRENNLKAAEKELDNLRQKVQEIPGLIQNAQLEATKKAKDSAEKSKHFEVKALQNKAESADKLATSEKAMLNERINALTEENTHLRKQLENANSKVVEVANSAITGAQPKIIQTSVPQQQTATK